MSEHNKAIWDSVCVSNPDHLKEVTFGRKHVAIDPMSQVERATELWGPYGEAWGLISLKFNHISLDVPPKVGQKARPGYTEQVMMLECDFFYPGGSFPIAVDMVFRPNDDCLKKIVTAARSKALSLVGFNADVYLGKFDEMDTEYSRNARIRHEEASALENRISSSIRLASSLKELDLVGKRLSDLIADGSLEPEVGRRMSSLLVVQRESFESAE